MSWHGWIFSLQDGEVNGDVDSEDDDDDDDDEEDDGQWQCGSFTSTQSSSSAFILLF